MSYGRRRSLNPAIAACASGLILVVMVACGRGSDPESAATAAVPSGFGAFDALDTEQLTACMQAGGFELDASAPGALFGGSDPAAAEQLRACAGEQGVTLPEGGPTGNGFPGGNQEELNACLREAGI